MASITRATDIPSRRVPFQVIRLAVLKFIGFPNRSHSSLCYSDAQLLMHLSPTPMLTALSLVGGSLVLILIALVWVFGR